MVFKCINNFAPDYLSELIKLREPRKHCVRLDNDYFLLEYVMNSNIKRAEGAFSLQAPKIWNDLPYDLRSVNDLSVFKRKLKTYYFTLAFKSDMDVDDLLTFLG